MQMGTSIWGNATERAIKNPIGERFPNSKADPTARTSGAQSRGRSNPPDGTVERGAGARGRRRVGAVARNSKTYTPHAEMKFLSVNQHMSYFPTEKRRSLFPPPPIAAGRFGLKNACAAPIRKRASGKIEFRTRMQDSIRKRLRDRLQTRTARKRGIRALQEIQPTANERGFKL